MKIIKGIIISLGVTVLSAGMFLALTAMILEKTGSLPRDLFPVITTVIGCIAVFLGGGAAALLIREKGALCGLLCAGIFFLTAALVSAACGNGFGAAGAGKGAALLISGALGGILGVNRKSRVKF